MTPDERDDLADLLPKNPVLWSDDDELNWWPSDPWTWSKWRRVLDHEPAHRGCCTACGCCAPCLLSTFYEAVTMSTIRELDRLGALRWPPGREVPDTMPDTPDSRLDTAGHGPDRTRTRP